LALSAGHNSSEERSECEGDRLLQLLIFNEEYLVGACHQRASITSLPFVHTARRSYRLNDPVSFFGLWQRFRFAVLMPREDTQTLSFRGRRSRNKVSVGEPAEGSLSFLHPHSVYLYPFYLFVGVWCRLERLVLSGGIARHAPCFGRLVW